jgi:hypothetical protein
VSGVTLGHPPPLQEVMLGSSDDCLNALGNLHSDQEVLRCHLNLRSKDVLIAGIILLLDRQLNAREK